jgi:UDP-2,3-diacylglucosamine pyrophosphatase LpxH
MKAEWQGRHGPRWNLLLLSDLHLGDQLPGEARELVEERSQSMDERFASFLTHHTRHRLHQLPWRLVLAGDTLDFMHCHVDLSFQGGSAPGEQWRILPYSPKHSRRKLRQLWKLHPRSLAALTRFLAAGHQLVIIPGNHDAELGWKGVQEAFCELLLEQAKNDSVHLRRDVCESSVMFVSDFYFEPNRIYVEHGHHYDHLCTTELVQEPFTQAYEQEEHLVSPVHIMGRFQNACQNSLSKLEPDYIDTWGKKEYIQFYRSLSWSEQWQLTRHMLSTTFALVKVSVQRQWRLHREQQQTTSLAREGQSNLLTMSQTTVQKPVDYRIKPMYDHLLDTASTLYLDKLALLVMVALSMAMIFGSQKTPSAKAFLMSVIMTMFVGMYVLLERRQKPESLHKEMKKAAEALSLHPRVPLVVFGHSHEFLNNQLAPDATYVNLGAWTLMGEDREKRTMPYLVLTTQGYRDVLLFKSWGERDFEESLQRVRGEHCVLSGFHPVGRRSSHHFSHR